MPILQLAIKYLLERTGEAVSSRVTHALAPVAPYLRQLSLGLGCIILSLPCFMLTLLFLTASLFLQLLHGSDWSIPALWTSLVTTIVGGGFLGAGLSILKKKYRPNVS